MQWREIDGGKWPYRVSNQGHVQVLKEGEWIDVSIFLHSNQAQVQLRGKDGVKHNTSVARLVAGAFIGPVGPKKCVLHRNRMKMDNTVENLIIVPKGKENSLCKGGARRRPVEKISPTGEALGIYKSVKEAAEKNFVCINFVAQRCKMKIKRPFDFTGYSFRYEGDEWRKKNEPKRKGGRRQAGA